MLEEMTFSMSHTGNVEEASFWMTDQFVFDKETPGDIAKMLERTYK